MILLTGQYLTTRYSIFNYVFVVFINYLSKGCNKNMKLEVKFINNIPI